MSIEELLKPRYKVVADYPGNVQPIGHIHEVMGDTASVTYWCMEKDKYPHLFKKLEWWEEREPEEMPEYVKYWDISLYFPVDIVCKGSEAPFNAYNWTADNFLPASAEEYNNYKAKKDDSTNG